MHQYQLRTTPSGANEPIEYGTYCREQNAIAAARILFGESMRHECHHIGTGDGIVYEALDGYGSMVWVEVVQ